MLASAGQGPPGPQDYLASAGRPGTSRSPILLASAGQGPPGPQDLLASAGQGRDLPGPRTSFLVLATSAGQGPPGPWDLVASASQGPPGLQVFLVECWSGTSRDLLASAG